MRILFIFGIPLLLLISIATATPEDSPASLLEAHLWQDRVVVVVLCADASLEACRKQRIMLYDASTGLQTREVVMYDVIRYSYVREGENVLPHLPASRFFDFFRTGDAPFTVILIGKDGEEKHLQTTPITAQALFSLIDAMPMRQEEVIKPQQ
jgi:Domain of unknown function (DUF4174)